MFKRLGGIEEQLYEVELVKSDNEHKESINDDFLILQFAKFRLLELYHYFFHNFCNVTMFKNLEIDIDFLYLPLA